MRCRACNALLSLAEQEAVRGGAGPVEVEVFGLRLGRCDTEGHPPEPPFPDFVADLVSGACRGGALPTARESGLLRRRTQCFGCGEALAAEPRSGELQARVRVERAPPLTLSVRGALLRCPGCRKLQLSPDPAQRVHLEEALLAALAAAGLRVE